MIAQLILMFCLKIVHAISYRFPRIVCVIGQPPITCFLELGARNSTQTFFCTKLFEKPFGSWTSAPKIVDVRTKNVLFCSPGDGEKPLDPRTSKRKGQECPPPGNPDQ